MTAPSVFQLAKPPKKKISRAMEIDPDLLKIEHNTPIPKGRPAPGKYDELFASLKAGSCVACDQPNVATWSQPSCDGCAATRSPA